eukprot:TRINITY_DN21903_c0_g1_i1.p1 TRINITY_DN21903_c0_g1~~TRINITY_DN21903_c0_g1_i1.p1  ORF type:complete len:345 (+),score=65.95 TRINITY_DN21903_c0_g1_i1:52-1086(+)
MFPTARCALLVMAASSALTERVDVPLVNVQPGTPVSFELPAPTSKTALGSLYVANTLPRSESGCDATTTLVKVLFEFPSNTTLSMRLDYAKLNQAKELTVGLNTSTIQVTVSTASCAVALQIRASFFQITNRAFNHSSQVLVMPDDTFPFAELSLSLGGGPGAFVTRMELWTTSLSGCTEGPPTVMLVPDTNADAPHVEAVVEEGGPPLVLLADVMQVGFLDVFVMYVNKTGVSCQLTGHLNVQGFEVEVGTTPAPETPTPPTPFPPVIYTPQPTLYMPTPYPPLPTPEDDHTVLIVLLSVFLGVPLLASMVGLVVCWCCIKKQRSDGSQAPSQCMQPVGPNLL